MHKFTKDYQFYPTPLHVIHMMEFNPCNKVVADFSAGKGDLLDYALREGAKKVVAAEIDENLRNVLIQKNIPLIAEDCLTLTTQQVREVDLIVLNPPFRNAVKHINHCFDILKQGGSLVAILNSKSLEKYKRHTYDETELLALIKKYGFKRELGKVFTGKDTERKTYNTEITLVHLHKPVTDTDEFNFDDFYFGNEGDIYNQTEFNTQGLMSYTKLDDYISRVRGGIKYYDELLKKGEQLSDLLSPFGFEKKSFEYYSTYDKQRFNMRDFQLMLYKKAWDVVYQELKIEKYITTDVKNKVDEYFEERGKIPFTKENIFLMIDYIIRNAHSMQRDSLKKAVGYFTSMAYNSKSGNGWKTNKDNILNYRIIVPRCCKRSGAFEDGTLIEPLYRGDGAVRIDDIMKLLFIMKGLHYDSAKHSFDALLRREQPTTRQQMNWNDIFNIRCYYTGTAHLEFKNEDDWARLNLEYNKVMGNPISKESTNVTWKTRKKVKDWEN